ncbi:MAG TPA: archaeosortase/exosortase family protein, partial [Planctomycetota bacterium]|nr:archaeosortase/exosortase family protein [Planctomycetota bacterium]
GPRAATVPIEKTSETLAARRASLVPASILAILYALAAPNVPPILALAIALLVPVSILSALLWGRSLQIGLAGLAIISLPQMQGLESILGYPLRVAVGMASVPLLRLHGHDVVLEGTGLVSGGTTVWIDAPCSGVRMLWTGAWLTSALILLFDVSILRAILAGAVAFLLLVLANVIRTAALFYAETSPVFSSPVSSSESLHEAIGIAVFALFALLVVAAIFRITRADRSRARPAVGPPRGTRAFLVCAVASVAIQLAFPSGGPTSSAPAPEFPGWPERLRDVSLEPVPLDEKERIFAADFPGRMARFRAGEAQVVLRWVTAVTRAVHPADVCYLAHGYAISRRSILQEPDGSTWAFFVAEKGDVRHLVRERIRDDDGRQWTDLSSWLWQATLGSLEGPWWSEVWITVAGGER